MIVLDVETSGTHPDKHSILAIGAVDFDNPTNQFYDECRAWDGAHIESEALEINGFTKEEAQDTEKKSEAELVGAFVAWALTVEGDRTLVAQNVGFDFDFVRSACARAHVEFPFARRTIDIHTLVWTHMRTRGITPPTANNHSALSSKEVLAYCGLPEEQKPHNALTGALWHAEVLARIAYTKKIIMDFETYDIPWLTK
jgi:DNA polymerase III epsilon subunit-like protein